MPAKAVGAPPSYVPTELNKVSLPPYVIEPPDILLIESTQRIPDQPIRGQHLVRPDGTVSLGGRILRTEPVSEVPLSRRYLLG